MAVTARPYRRLLAVSVTVALGVVAAAGPVLACAGLVTPGGNIKLLRTSTLSAWADGYEHYVTSFSFEGGGAEFGSIVPLPGIPSKVERGGDWTLQRLERETQPQPARSAAPQEASATSGDAEVVYETRIDALDITILKGGGAAVGKWAQEHGFALTPDAPEVLDFYAARSPIFMAARFDADAARERGQEQGEGTPIHLTIPMDNPWVPLRILGLGRDASEQIDADVYLLTPDKPALLPAPGDGLLLLHSEPASTSLLDDLRSDKGMEWIPQEMWLTYLRVVDEQSDLRYDLAIDRSEAGQPSPVMAGLEPPAERAEIPEEAEPTTTTLAPTTTTTAAPEPAPAPAPAPKPVTPATSPPTATPTPPADPAPEEIPVPVPDTDVDPGGADPAPPTDDAPVEPEVALSKAAADGGGPGGAAVAGALLGAGLGAAAVAGALHRRRQRTSV